MFIKKITKRNKEAKAIYLTYRLVRSYRLDGKTGHETIIDFRTLWGLEPSEYKQLAKDIYEVRGSFIGQSAWIGLTGLFVLFLSFEIV